MVVYRRLSNSIHKYLFTHAQQNSFWLVGKFLSTSPNRSSKWWKWRHLQKPHCMLIPTHRVKKIPMSSITAKSIYSILTFVFVVAIHSKCWRQAYIMQISWPTNERKIKNSDKYVETYTRGMFKYIIKTKCDISAEIFRWWYKDIIKIMHVNNITCNQDSLSIINVWNNIFIVQSVVFLSQI